MFIEQKEGEPKLSVVVPEEKYWEYRCSDCLQLRLYAAKSDEKPTECGKCGSKNLTIGRPGTLPVDDESEWWGDE